MSATCLAPGEAPTLELEIYDGPDYSESDNMCYYRIEATGTGMPEPEIEFGEDDNVNLLGSGRVEVGVEVGGSYTLHTTSTNSAGTATASIILIGECADSDTDPDDDTDTDTDTDSDDDVDTDTDTDSDDDADTDTDSDDDTDTDTDTDSDDYADVVKEAPTISLAIYEGPTFEEGICYSRVKATVTGSPTPTVSWSKDDSGGAWLPKKVQVNINNPGDTYTLTATATNSEGSTTATIVINWGCPVPGPEPEPEPIETTVPIGADAAISGYIIVGRNAHSGTNVYVGDTSSNKQVKTYLSFDISSISAFDDITIKDVWVTIPIQHIFNHPELASSVIHIKVYDYGSSLDYPADQAVGGELVKTLSTSAALSDMNFSSNKLVDELQKAVELDKQWLQLKIGLGGLSADGIDDYYMISIPSVVLHVKYETPG